MFFEVVWVLNYTTLGSYKTESQWTSHTLEEAGTCWLCCLMTSSRRARSWSKESGCLECKSFKALINTESISTELLTAAILLPLRSMFVPSLQRNHLKNMSSSNTSDTPVLNAGGQLQENAISALDLSKDLQRLMLKIKGSFITEEGRAVDYSALKESDLFQEYVDRTKALKAVNLGNLEQKEKIAFFLSIFYQSQYSCSWLCWNRKSSFQLDMHLYSRPGW